MENNKNNLHIKLFSFLLYLLLQQPNERARARDQLFWHSAFIHLRRGCCAHPHIYPILLYLPVPVCAIAEEFSVFAFDLRPLWARRFSVSLTHSLSPGYCCCCCWSKEKDFLGGVVFISFSVIIVARERVLMNFYNSHSNVLNQKKKLCNK